MSRVRLLRCVAYLPLLVAPGCQVFCRDRPISVLVTDAETGVALADARVKLAYAHPSATFGPADAVVAAGRDGVARLSASPADEWGVTVSVEAAGYLPEKQFLTTTDLKAIQPAPLLFGSAEGGKPTLTLALYSGPRPGVELVVPTGYRGVVKAEVHVQEDAPFPAGQRCFRFAVPTTGEVRITAPRLLQELDFRDFTAKYADGTPLPWDVKDAEVGLWYLDSYGDHYTFLVGTKAELDRWKASSGERGGDAPKDKASRGGRRGGGRRGGQPTP